MKIRSNIHGNSIIYRYMTYEKLIDLLVNKRIFFSHTDDLSDNREITLPPSNSEKLDSYLKKVQPNINDGKIHSIKKSLRNLKDDIYISSWTSEKKESYLLWRSYTQFNQIGVLLGAKVGSLTDSIKAANTENFVLNISESTYKDFIAWESLLNPNLEWNREVVISNKLQYYRGESEVRLYIHTRELQPHIYLNLDNLDFISSIIVSPFVKKWFRETLIKSIRALGSFKFEIIASEISESE